MPTVTNAFRSLNDDAGDVSEAAFERDGSKSS